MEQKAEQKIAHFQIKETLGSGALGNVYLAWDTKLNRNVALKVLPPEVERPELREFFHLEARTLAALDHPNIVRLLDFADTSAPEQFIALEHLQGRSLSSLILDHGPATEQVALCVGYELASALEHAHSKNVVHRDIKPENVILEGGRLVLIDFGAMTLVDRNTLIPTSSPSSRRLTVGTVGFMAPEQVGGGKMDGRVDIFSVGALLYRATTGELPYWIETQDIRQLQEELNKARYRDPRDFQPLLSPGFCELLAECLITSPTNRLASAAVLKSHIQKLLTAHGIESVADTLQGYAANPELDQRHDLRTVDALVRELRLALLRDHYRAIKKQDDGEIRATTSRLRYFSGLYGAAEEFFLVDAQEKPRLLRARRMERRKWVMAGALAAALAVGITAIAFPSLPAAVHKQVGRLVASR